MKLTRNQDTRRATTGRFTTRVHRTSDLSIVTGTPTALTWQAADYDPAAMWNGSTLITVPITGVYLICHNVIWATSAIGVRTARVLVNGSSTGVHVNVVGNLLASFNAVNGGTTIKFLTQGNTVALEVEQDSGLGLAVAASSQRTFLAISLLGYER